MKEVLLKTSQLAEILQCSEKHILRGLIPEGLPHRRLGERSYRYDWDEVDAWLKRDPDSKASEGDPVLAVDFGGRS